MEKIIMIKYGELTTKKGNREQFINTLYQNIVEKLKNFNYKIKKDRVRMYIESEDMDKIIKILTKIFGIHSIVIAYKTSNKELDTIKKESLELIKDLDFNTFKVETNRADKNYNLNSMEISRQVGGFLLANLSSKKVDVHNPELTLSIDLRCEGCFIYTNVSEIPGIGGYPIGIQGKGLLMLSGGIDSPVSGYLAMKRGIKIECIYFESPPHTSIEAKNKVISLAKHLCDYTDKIKIHVLKFKKLYIKMVLLVI